MDVDAARRVLGVDAGADTQAIRAAYRRLLLATHPDVSPREDATRRTVELTAAYRSLVAAPATRTGQHVPPDTSTPGHRTEPPTADAPVRIGVALVDDETIGIAAPPDETLLLLLDMANRLGDVSYLDRSAGLIEIVVEFIEAPTSSIVLTTQGRGSGVTEVFCTVEPLSGGDAPPAAAVTRLLVDTLLER